VNHQITSKTLNILALQTGSKNRVRVPVAGVRNTQVIKPGDKVIVKWNKEKSELKVQKVAHPRKCKKAYRKRNYTHTVEKNGAIRISAHTFGLPGKNICMTCDSMSGTIGMV